MPPLFTVVLSAARSTRRWDGAIIHHSESTAPHATGDWGGYGRIVGWLIVAHGSWCVVVVVSTYIEYPPRPISLLICGAWSLETQFSVETYRWSPPIIGRFRRMFLHQLNQNASRNGFYMKNYLVIMIIISLCVSIKVISWNVEK